MIDAEYKVRRYISEFSKHTDKLVAEYDLSSFDLKKFQAEFGEQDPSNPMFNCYHIKEENIPFLQKYISQTPKWDLDSRSYFIEAHTI